MFSLEYFLDFFFIEIKNGLVMINRNTNFEYYDVEIIIASF